MNSALFEYAPRSVLWTFVRLMEFKMRLNDHKGGWERDTVASLCKRLLEETGELVALLMDRDGGEPEAEEVAKEAADIANFAMIILDRFVGGLPETSPLASQKDIEEIRALVDGTIEPVLTKMTFPDERGGMSLSIKKAWPAKVLAGAFAELVKEAPNYIEMEIDHVPTDGETTPLLVTVQRRNKPSAHNLRKRAEAQRDALLGAARSVLEASDDASPMYKKALSDVIDTIEKDIKEHALVANPG